MGQKSIILAIALIIFAVILGIVFMISRIRTDSTDNTDTTTKTPIAEKDTTIRVTDVVNDPNVYSEITIEVEGPVTDWLNKKAFIVSNTSERGGIFNNTRRTDLIVISDKNFKLPKDTKGAELGLGETSNVLLEGKVKIVTAEELARILGLSYDEEEGAINDSNMLLDDFPIEDFRRGSIILLESVEKVQ